MSKHCDFSASHRNHNVLWLLLSSFFINPVCYQHFSHVRRNRRPKTELCQFSFFDFFLLIFRFSSDFFRIQVRIYEERYSGINSYFHRGKSVNWKYEFWRSWLTIHSSFGQPAEVSTMSQILRNCINGKFLDLPAVFTICVRYATKPRWVPVAKTKQFRVSMPKPVPPAEDVEIRRLYNNYRAQLRATMWVYSSFV